MNNEEEKAELRAKVHFSTGPGSPPMLMVMIHDGGHRFTGVATSDDETLNDVVLRVVTEARHQRRRDKRIGALAQAVYSRRLSLKEARSRLRGET